MIFRDIYLKKYKSSVTYFVIFAFLLLPISGCVINKVTSHIDPGTDLSTIRHVYVKKLPADQRGIDELIANQLEVIGIKSSLGKDDQSTVDAIVTYEDKWMWDITNYMFQLTINLRDKESNYPIAYANAQHGSLTRKTPEEMVEEVVNNLFGISHVTTNN